MRDFLVSGTMPFILVMSVYFLVRFVMYLLPSKSKGTFLFKAQWHFKKPWLIVPTVVLVVVYTTWRQGANPQTTSQFGSESATRLREAGFASNRASAMAR